MKVGAAVVTAVTFAAVNCEPPLTEISGQGGSPATALHNRRIGQAHPVLGRFRAEIPAPLGITATYRD